MRLLGRRVIFPVLLLAAAAPARAGEVWLRQGLARPPSATVAGPSIGVERSETMTSPGVPTEPTRRVFSNGLPVFVQTYLSPRLDARLASLGRLVPTGEALRLRRDPATWESLAATAQADSRRAIESAARGYLTEKTGLDRVSVSFSRRAGRAGGGSPTGSDRAARLRLGFSGIVPRMDCSVPAGRGEFRLQVEALGDVTIRYEDGKPRGVSMGADLHPRHGEYGVSLLGRF